MEDEGCGGGGEGCRCEVRGEVGVEGSEGGLHPGPSERIWRVRDEGVMDEGCGEAKDEKEEDGARSVG